MSRVAKNPINLPKGVEINVGAESILVKGPKGAMELRAHADVEVAQEGGVLQLRPAAGDESRYAITGTYRALINNMVQGVSAGFERKLELVGVGYRAQAQGNKLNLTLGFSHPVEYPVPEGITIETPSQTEILVKGIDKQKVGQVAAEIRSYRPPEPYKGKGVRYANEQIIRKEAKKK
ncbi:LSU ribosomal protein L6P [Ectothiorhodosinus mongolicus]|uniref:Large ribosomal subunit protein uL6 n=1 Tax=Ectothiorhodosinus mongolicus TaxID=233100 RepID=A0A1R3W0G6_9GAMM|nr:50S ribosomal protein L6 [Ectothiorhodosinus mongolicus]ULX57293.1 50S ribosomal protein L6 [Ectothiorhodosinus mongolicus]SIT70832.1 LSU ribosomal protein L6P [Ectothiorhodosinus mongolicus]